MAAVANIYSFQFFVWSLYLLVAQQFELNANKNVRDQQNSTLVLVHVLFRHGDRIVNGREELYPKDPYLNETYFPFGLGQLTNVGKMKQYSLGQALRRQYEDHLGPLYYPEIVEGWSTDYHRTKVSLALVFAGLFPPHHESIWNPNLNWQPIPYNYYQSVNDKALLGVTCPYYLKLYEQHIRSAQLQSELEQHRQIFQYIANNTGLNVTTYLDVYKLYFGITTEEEWGLKLPKWTESIWPKTLTDLAIKEYFIATATTTLNQMASGYLLQKIVADTFSKINNTDSGKKIYLYSAHENNVANLLILLQIFEPLHVPKYGSYVALEVHQIDGKYGIKMFYQSHDERGLQLLKLPACETFCEIGKFVSLIEEYFPADDLCYRQ